MALVEYTERGDEAAELPPLCAACGPFHAPGAQAVASPASGRHGVHPATWVAAAVLIPLLCWDAWQSLQEAKLRWRTPGAPLDRASSMLDARR